MAYTRAHQLNFDNQSPAEGLDADVWSDACTAIGEQPAGFDAVEILAGTSTQTALHRALAGKPLDWAERAALTQLGELVRATQGRVQAKYAELAGGAL